MKVSHVREVERAKDKILSLDIPEDVLLKAIKGVEYTLLMREEQIKKKYEVKSSSE